MDMYVDVVPELQRAAADRIGEGFRLQLEAQADAFPTKFPTDDCETDSSSAEGERDAE